jgi:hypothetical protein
LGAPLFAMIVEAGVCGNVSWGGISRVGRAYGACNMETLGSSCSSVCGAGPTVSFSGRES